MSTVSKLLTAGSVVGKICETLANAMVQTDDATGVAVALSSFSLGGVSFFQSNAESNDGTMKTYVGNNTSCRQSVAFPNIGDEGASASYTLGALDKIPIDNFLTANVSPETNIIVGPAIDMNNGIVNDPDGQAIRIVGKGIKLGQGRQIDEFNVTADRNGLLIVSVVAIVAIVMLSLRRDGHEVIDATRRNVNEEENLTGNGLKTYKVDINLEEYGLKEGDVIDEMVLSLLVKDPEHTRTGQNNLKMTPVELRLIKELQNELNKNK